MARARKYGLQLEAANVAVAQAKEDRVQAKAATLPSVNALNQFIYTEGNGTPSGVFVANDGVHVYNEQAQVHEDVLSFVRRGEIRRAEAAEAAAKAKLDVAARGLNATVIQDYYAIVAAQRKLANVQTSLGETENFLDITQKQERGGEAAHAARTDYRTQATGRSTLPHFEVPYRQNLGYVAQTTLTIPIWDWGSIRSKAKQADLKRKQAETELTLAQRQLQANLASFYKEATTAQSQVESLRSSADLAAESLRLTVLRYQAGEATVLEVVDAQTTVTQARSARDDGLVRYRVALAELQTLTGTF